VSANGIAQQSYRFELGCECPQIYYTVVAAFINKALKEHDTTAIHTVNVHTFSLVSFELIKQFT